MNYDIKFKSIEYSESLAEYVRERFEKLERFAIRPITVHVTFSHQRHMKIASVYIKGFNGNFRARGESDSLYVSLDMCVKKLSRQLEREKSRIKEHHHPVDTRRAA